MKELVEPSESVRIKLFVSGETYPLRIDMLPPVVAFSILAIRILSMRERGLPEDCVKEDMENEGVSELW